MKISKEERLAAGVRKLNKLINDAQSGDPVCLVTEHVKDRLELERDDVSFTKANSNSNLPPEELVDFYQVHKK